MMNTLSSEERNLPRAAIVFAGPSGCGKSTLIENIKRIDPQNYGESQARYTSRPMRKGETEKNGHFIDTRTFLDMHGAGQFIYNYFRYEHYFGFSGPIIQTELEKKNTMLVGGQEDTARGLKESLQNYLEEQRMPGVLPHAVLLFISRKIDAIMQGIRNRPDNPSERAKRIAYVEEHYSPEPKILKPDEVVIVENDGDPEEGARRIIALSQELRQRALQELLGSLGTERDYRDYAINNNGYRRALTA